MTTSSNTFSDEELTAYLDDELDADTAERITMALAQDAALGERLAALDIPMDAIRNGFDAVLPHAPQPPLTAPAPVSAWRPVAAAACVALMLGVGGGYMLRAPAAPGWMEAAAAYQALYVPATLDAPAPDAATRDASLARVSDAVGRDLRAVAEVDGLAFRRAQILGFGETPLIQIAYVDAAGAPVALCITLDDGGDTDVDTAEMSRLAAAHWRSDGHGFLLIGGEDQLALARMAAQLKAQL